MSGRSPKRVSSIKNEERAFGDIEIIAGNNITIEQDDKEFTISSTGGSGEETDPIFSASEASNFETGDKDKLDSALQEETDPVWTADKTSYSTTSEADLRYLKLTDGFLSVQDTLANILATTPTTPILAYATDKDKILIWSDGAWYVTNFRFIEETGNPDMGNPLESNDLGYGEDYITDKKITNSSIGSNANETEGSIRTSGGELQIYLDGWKTVVTGYRFRENEDGQYQLEHKPMGFDTWIIVFSGNSNETGLNGRPIVQQYKVDMGAYPTLLTLNCGEF